MTEKRMLALEIITNNGYLCGENCPFGDIVISVDTGQVLWRCRLFGLREAEKDYGPTCLTKPGGADPKRTAACLRMGGV